MAIGDLTTLAKVKAWLGATQSNTQDDQIARLITSASAAALNIMNRTAIGSALYSERYDGTGSDVLMVRQGPVTAVSSITYDNGTITTPATGNPPTGGYLIDSTPSVVGRIIITDDIFPRGRQNVSVSYRAGFQVVENAVAATSYQTLQTWLSDVSVTYANGTPLTAVAANPAQGQYAVADQTTSTPGLYTFNAADSGVAIVITYGSPPDDIEQAVIELVGERYRAKDRIGVVSQTLAGQEVTTYSQRDFGPTVMSLLQPFIRVTRPR
jgi:hypothetical protein